MPILKTSLHLGSVEVSLPSSTNFLRSLLPNLPLVLLIKQHHVQESKYGSTLEGRKEKKGGKKKKKDWREGWREGGKERGRLNIHLKKTKQNGQ